MNLFLLLSLCTYAFALYTDIDDSINIDAVIVDPPEIRRHLNCYLDKKPCTRTMETYKRHMKEIITNGCKDCSLLQKHKIEEFLQVLEKKYPDDVRQLRAKYDTDGTHFKAFEKEMAKY